MVKTKKYILSKHFDGIPKATDIQLVEEELPPLKEGEFLTEALFLSVDPYQRFREPSLELGSVLLGLQVGRITESKHSKFPVGKNVIGHFGWRTHSISDGIQDTQKGYGPPAVLPDMDGVPLSLALGVLGMPGNSSYFGFLEICQPKPGETVVVTGAGGAVGSHVGQIAKIKGCKVIGVAGDDKKGKWLIEELGFDHFINYKENNFADTLSKCAPNGVDCYFDNVGGEISSTIIQQMNEFGRISVCGAITSYNADRTDLPKATLIQEFVLMKQLKMEGFYVGRWKNRWPEGTRQNMEWIKQGKLKYKETVTEGFENTFKAFTNMLEGENIGKAIVKI